MARVTAEATRVMDRVIVMALAAMPIGVMPTADDLVGRLAHRHKLLTAV